jgi:GNAT superfamily N-acetyltransferase
MAVGLMNITRRRHLKNIVLVSCQDDFVGIGSVEPDWLFECHNHRLLQFQQMYLEDWEKKASATEGLLKEMDAKLLQLPKLRDLAEHVLTESAGVSSNIAAGAAALVAQAEKELRSEEAAKAVAVSTLAAAREQISLARSRQTLGDGADSEYAPQTDKEEIWQCMPEVLRPPLVELEVRRALPREWLHFREHHYKDHSLQGSTIAFVGLVCGRAVAFVGIVPEAIHFVRRGVAAALEGRHPEWANSGYPLSWLEMEGSGRKLFREHRTVVLPDAQGMGFGPLLCDAVALIISRCGHDFTSQTVHPHYGSYRNRSPFWRPLPTNQAQEKGRINGNQKYSHFFVGAACKDDGSEDAELLQLLQNRVVIETC